jgi:iron complex outermembrane receptor protein
MLNNDKCQTAGSWLLPGMRSAGTGLALAALATAAQAGQAVSTDVTLEEIVVTAEHRAEDLQNVASSISVREGDKLLELGKFSLEQILEDVPGVNVTSTRGSGGAGTDNPGTAIVMRGIASNVTLASSSISLVPPTATYSDGVYGGIGGDYDLDRVEVLRGPQGTLYGRSATAGVVARYSRNPQLGETHGTVALEGGNYNLFHGSFGLNLPLGDKAAVRISGMHFQRDGYYAKNGDAQEQNALRVKLLVKPSDRISILLGAAMQDNTSHTGELAGYLPSVSTPDVVAYVPVAAPTGSASVIGTNKGRFRQYWAEANIDLGAVDLTYIPAIRTWTQDSVAYNFVTSPPAAPQIFRQPITTPSDHFHTQELRLASKQAGKFTWQAGGLFYNNGVRARNLNYDYPALGVVTDLNSDRNTHKDTTDTGVFAEATYRFTDALRFTGGVRKDWTTLKVDETYVRQPNPAPFPPFPVGPQQTATLNVSQKYDNFTYKARLEADLSPTSLVYGSVSTGFLPGDISVVQQTVAGVDSLVRQDLPTETLTSYEVGTKNRFLGGKLQVNGAIYYYDYGAYQLAGVNIGSVFAPSFVTLSSPAKVTGGELEIAWQATRSDRIGLNVAYTDAQFTKSSGQFKTYVALSQMPNVAKTSGQAFYSHKFELNNGQALTFNIDGRYQGSQLLNVIAQSSINSGKLPLVQIGGQFVGNASIAWNVSKNFLASAYIRNFTDNRYKSAAQYIPPGPPPAPQVDTTVARQYDPRTYGLVLNYQF